MKGERDVYRDMVKELRKQLRLESSVLLIPGNELLDRERGVREVEADVFHVEGLDGFVVFRAAIPVEQQLVLARRCLADFSSAEYTNLTNLYGPGDGLLWQRAVETKSFDQFDKLRWVNIGVPYDWTARKYKLSPEDEKIADLFPRDVHDLLSVFAERSGYGPFQSETAIINFYHSSSQMGAHVDDAEFALSKPVVSASLGAPAIFLIGGETKETKPIALLLLSGDVVVMGGSCRKSYHAVACIRPDLDAALNQRLQACDIGSDWNDKADVINYLCKSRINVNVRQIHATPV